MSNYCTAKRTAGTTEEKAQVVKAEIAKLIEVAEAGGKITVFVTNESWRGHCAGKRHGTRIPRYCRLGEPAGGGCRGQRILLRGRTGS